jgi:hypothetical protein
LAKSDLQLQILSEKDWEQWDEFVRKSPQGTIFQTASYLNCFTGAFERDFDKLAITQYDKILAGITLLPKKAGWISYATSPYLIPFNGLLFSENTGELSYLKQIKRFNKITTLLLEYIRTHYHFIEMYLSDTLPDLREFLWNNWQLTPDYTIEIPLEGLSIKNLPHNQRRHINKFSILESQFNETEDFAKCYDLMKNSYAYHQKIPPVSKEEFQKFSTVLSMEKLSKTFIVMLENQIASFLMIIEDAPYAYALFSGKDFSKVENESELYLHWKVLEYYADKKYQFLNLLGAMSPSISRVKLELGGLLKRNDHALYFKNGFYRTLYRIENLRKNKSRNLT